jgi:CRISPR-associated exonuclease Cas4
VPDAVPITDLARATYCPRQLYYARREDESDRKPPASVRRVQALAFRYDELRDAGDDALASLPIACAPATYRDRLDRVADRDDWAELADPTERDVLLAGKDVRGVAHKLLAAGDGLPTPAVVSPGDPPDRGVWKPQRVRAVALAKAVSWELGEPGEAVERALVEYPAHGVVRTVALTVGNRAAYRRALRVVRTIDGPPSRLRDTEKCESCEYSEECGVRTRSLRSLLGLG